MAKLITRATLLACALLVTGCETASTDASPAGWPENYRDFTIVWTGEKDIDLIKGPAPAVRAYIESFFLADLTGDKKYLYPGFHDAVPEQWRPGTGSPADEPWVGTMTNHLLSLSRNDDHVSAIGCMYSYGAASPDGKGEYSSLGVPIGAPEGGINAFKVTLTVGPASSDTGPPQAGPARAPFDNVFGDYRISGYWGGYIEANNSNNWNWPERQQANDECIAKAPDPFERRKYLMENFLPQSEFYASPPKPGWAAPPQS